MQLGVRPAVAVLLLLVPLAVPAVPADHVPDDELKSACTYGCEIPTITDPSFETPDYLAPGDEVVGVTIDGDARAYPVKVLNYHEIVNDRVGGVPVAVTYCPLCDAGVAFDRRVEDRTVSFRVSGWLYRNNLVMEDNVTLSWFSQITGEGIRRKWHGVQLDVVSSTLTTWQVWQDRHPDTKLLARPGTYPNGTYEEDPYAPYRTNRRFVQNRTHVDPRQRIHPKTQMLGVEVGGEAKAYELSDLREAEVVNDRLGGRSIVVAHVPGSANVFLRGERILEPAGNLTMRDGQGRTYDRLDGSGPTGLEPLPSTRVFWFAWYDVHPDTLVHELLLLTGSDPPHGATEVPTSSPIRLELSRSVQEGTVAPGFAIDPYVGGRFAVDGANVTFVPDEPLKPGTVHTVTLEGVQAMDGTVLGRTRFVFTTEAAALPVPGWTALGGLIAALTVLGRRN